MPLSAEKKILICEQCGSPLQSQATEVGCLHCLLTTGIEPDEAGEAILPEESGARDYQHYQILLRPDGARWELGRGAMGVTYKARDMNLDTPVALKIINARFSARPDARRRFLHEAQAAARLRHPNVASVFHFGTINALPNPGGGSRPWKRMPRREIASTRWNSLRAKRLKRESAVMVRLRRSRRSRSGGKSRTLWRPLKNAVSSTAT